MDSASHQEQDLYQAIATILIDLQGDDPDSALDRLQQLKPQQAAPVLQQLLIDVNFERFDITLSALAIVDEHAFFDSARQLIAHERNDVRWYICEMLSEYRDGSILPALLDTARHDPDPDVRCSATLALAGWSDGRVIPVLQAIQRQDHEITSKGDRVAQIATRVLGDYQKLGLHAEATVAPEHAHAADAASGEQDHGDFGS